MVTWKEFVMGLGADPADPPVFLRADITLSKKELRPGAISTIILIDNSLYSGDMKSDHSKSGNN